MSSLSRRVFVGGVGAVSLTSFLAACGGDSTAPSAGGGGGGGLRWWDHFGGLQDLHGRWAAEQGEELGVSIEYTYNEPGRATEALQLANQSEQLPDIYSPQVIGLPLPALVDAGWAHALDLSDEAISRLPEGAFVEGLTMLDGVVYGLPTFADQQYVACTWYNSEIAEEVGFDGPRSYDEFRAALKAIADHGKYAPMTIGLGSSPRMREQLDDLAQAGGFPGYQGLRYDTGEYNYDHDAYINAIELYKEVSDNGWLLPGTNNFQIPDARGRFAAGNVGFHIDGPYSPGAVRALNPDFLPTMAVAGMLTPDGEEVVAARGARASDWLVSVNSADPKVATKVLDTFTSDEYQIGLAEAMDAPPMNLDIVAQADVIEPYAWLAADFKKRVFRAPQAQVRNGEVNKALALMKPVSPHVGDIIQGYLGGDVSDLRAELVKLNEAFEQSRDSAIEEAKSAGADVSREDWEFPDWQRGQDYAY